MPPARSATPADQAQEPVDLLVRAGFVYPADGAREVIPDREVALREGGKVHFAPACPCGSH